VPSNRRLQSPPGRTGSLVRGSYNFRKRPLRRSRYEHGGVGLGPVGRILAPTDFFSLYQRGAREPHFTEGRCGTERWPLYRQDVALPSFLELLPKAKPAIDYSPLPPINPG